MEMGDIRKPGDLEDLRAQASEWVARHDLGLTEAEQEAFLDWLAIDPLHSELFEEQLAHWQDFDVLEQWRPRHSEVPNPDLLALPHQSFRSHRILYAASLLAAMLVIGFGVWWAMSPDTPLATDMHLLADGEYAMGFERHTLEDGSQVQLNRGSQVAVLYSPHQRSVELRSGEAHFTVAKDATRPFVVEVDGIAIRAIGTAFSVDRQAQGVEVLVTEGQIQLESFRPHSANTNSHAEQRTFDLFAGQRTFIDLATPVMNPVIESVSMDQIESELAWKDKILEFNGAPLSRVIYEINLRHGLQIQIMDSELQNRRITAAIRADNVEGFLELLEVALGIQVKHASDGIIYLHR